MGNNKIHGTIPSAIGDLTGLSIFVLEYNLFSGPIPLSIGGLTKLQDIYLSANRFTGKLPSSLGNLTLLNSLCIEINNISGSIPPSLAPRASSSRRSLRNASAILLEGNTELCGGISELKLPPCPPMNPKKKNSHIPLKIIVPVSVSGAIFIAIVAFSYTFIRHKTKSRDDLYASPFESQFPRLSYADLLRATDGFSAANMIGSGRFGSKESSTMVT
ncbi:UNVERIFIED_CONTAM: hypothetical protein Sangu_2063300 [Sesamum angustifolium]|uniref:Uncharacterized protein n=1 Tax=Sesamum angustifolium TaxID=2727405 RepID=A0AAW2LLG9_9LAMI